MTMKVCLLLLVSLAGRAASPEDDVRAVLAAQVAAWNRGNIEEFVKTYSSETVFVGKEVSRGDKQVLERYKRNYSTPEKMGVLTFSGLEVRMLGTEYASVIGRFHLKRSAEGGGDASGMFTLLLRKTSGAWKIILDHTS
jgi:uncharacterized protein (TIGR02246 family)